VDIVSALGGENLEFLVIFKSAEKNKKIKKKQKFLHKIDLVFSVGNSKTNDVRSMKLFFKKIIIFSTYMLMKINILSTWW